MVFGTFVPPRLFDPGQDVIVYLDPDFKNYFL